MPIDYSLCPVCRRWVPFKFMRIDYDEIDNIHIKVCAHCLYLEGMEDEPAFNWELCTVEPEED